METSQTRLSDTAHQSSIRPADRYFQHEMTHQLYHGGVGERHRDKRKCVERERGDLKALIIQWSLIKAGRSHKEKSYLHRQTREKLKNKTQSISGQPYLQAL